jgi:hypothetical protein
MTEWHESQEPPFLFTSESIRHTQTVGNDSLNDIVVRKNDTLGITYTISSWPTWLEKAYQWYH